MLNITCWSKNRACQLDLSLSTFKKYFKEWNQCKLDIIYTFTDAFYEKGYKKVIAYHPEFNWILQKNFKKDTLDSIFNNDLPYQSFFVDDDIFTDHFSLTDNEFSLFASSNDIACLSPRLAPYVNFCYTGNGAQPAPLLVNGIWEWGGKPYDWGYPWSVASMHIFKKEDIDGLKNVMFYAPNSFEGVFLDNIRFPNKPKMICYNISKCICCTNNRVQTENNNRHENSHSLQDLNINFISGRRLDPDINEKTIWNMCHGPMKYAFK